MLVVSVRFFLNVHSAGISIDEQVAPRIFFFTMAILVPTIFLVLDAIHARFAQDVRTRRDRITEHVNIRMSKVTGESRGIPLLDLTGKSTDPVDPQTQYRKSLLVKLTRIVRLVFYGLQIVAANVILSAVLVHRGETPQLAYYWTAPMCLLLLLILYLLRNWKEGKVISGLPSDYDRDIDEHADGQRLT